MTQPAKQSELPAWVGPSSAGSTGGAPDELSLLDADALLAQKLVEASTGFSPVKVRQMAFLSVYAPGLYALVHPLVVRYQLNMSSGAAANIRKAIEARAMREMQVMRMAGGGKGKSD